MFGVAHYASELQGVALFGSFQEGKVEHVDLSGAGSAYSVILFT